jgi:YgiT-type zinc finger domain-containing protein
MRCHLCGSELKATKTDLPFKITQNTIVVVKGLPVLQCEGCTEYLLEDPVMERIEEILAKVDAAAELEVVKYAA